MTARPHSRRTRHVKVLVTPELYELISAAAERGGRTLSDWGQRVFEVLVSDFWTERAQAAHLTPLEWMELQIRAEDESTGKRSRPNRGGR